MKKGIIKIKNNKKRKLFIEPLEQRIMLDGAAASTFSDILDDRGHDQFVQNNKSKVNNFIETTEEGSTIILPFGGSEIPVKISIIVLFPEPVAPIIPIFCLFSIFRSEKMEFNKI